MNQASTCTSPSNTRVRCLGAHQMVRISRCSFQYRASVIAGTVLNMLFCRKRFMTLRLRNFYRMYKTLKSADILECNRQTRVVELRGILKFDWLTPLTIAKKWMSISRACWRKHLVSIWKRCTMSEEYLFSYCTETETSMETISQKVEFMWSRRHLRHRKVNRK